MQSWRLALFSAFFCFTGLAQAQSHEQSFGPYVVRASAVAGGVLPEATRRAHGIEITANRGVLNVVVVRGESPARPTVPAKVDAHVTNLLGQSEKLEMRAIRENGGVSYLGTFDFTPRQVLRFNIEVTPEGSTKSTTLEFEDRFFAG